MGPCKDCDDAPATVRVGVRTALCAPCMEAREHRKKEQAWARHISSTYGITIEQYNAMLQAQGGKCFVCQRASGKGRRLGVDHNHATGEVRALVCTGGGSVRNGRPTLSCNLVIGHLRDDPVAVQRLLKLLQDPPARAVLNAMEERQLREAIEGMELADSGGMFDD